MSAAEGLAQELGSRDREAQRRACDRALERLRGEPELRQELLHLLRKGDPHARFGAAFVLFSAEGPALRLLPALLEALDLDDGDLRWSAAHMLAITGRAQGEVLPVVLHETAQAPSARRRRMALYVLRELAPEREETAQALLAALGDRDADVRRAALTSLAKLQDPPAACLERALALLADPADPRQRRIAAIVLPELARHQPDSAPSVRTALERAAAAPDPSLARAATQALRRL